MRYRSVHHPGGASYHAVRSDDAARDAQVLARLQRMHDDVGALAHAHPHDAQLERLRTRLRSVRVYEVNNDGPGSSWGKGLHIGMCMRDARNELQPLPEVHTVFAHELAHVMSEARGHGPEFHANLARLHALLPWEWTTDHSPHTMMYSCR